jgi:hypothetical protein
MAALILAFASPSWAQLGKGVVTGTVLDPTGASIPGAAVSLISEATGTEKTAQSNATGLYRFDFVDPGAYTLRVNAPGFAASETKGLVVTVGQTVANDVHLELGKATVQTVTVEAGGVQLVNTSDAQISGLVNQNTIANLPLEIRDATAFVNLQPGAIPDVFNGSTRGAAVNGMRGGMGNFMVDGTDNNDYGQGGRSHNSPGTIPGGIVSVSPDAVQEFRVVTNNFSAQYGRQGGFVTDQVLKSGTNSLHGSAFEYNRNTATTGNDFFSNRDGLKDSYVRNQFGGSLGGPIKKDKMFVFGAVEFQRLRQEAPIAVTTLHQDFINFVNDGSFAKFVNQNLSTFGLSQPIDCSNPQNPGCTLGPNFKQLESKYPLTLSTENPGPAGSAAYQSASPLWGGTVYPVPMFGAANFSSRTVVNEARGDVRYDYQINATNSFTAHYIVDDFPTTQTGIGGDAYNLSFPSIAFSRTQNAALQYTHIFSPSIVNQASVSYVRSSASFPATDPQIPSILTIDAATVGFGTSSALPQAFTENTFQYQDNLAITRGRHCFKMGGEYRRARNGSTAAFYKNGDLYFWDMEDLLTDGAIGDLTGNGAFYEADMSVNPSAPTPSFPDYYRGFRGNEFGAYFQDDWKVTNNLTLNLGVRYDYFGVPHNFRPNTDSNFFFGSSNTSQCVIRNATGQQVCLPGSGVTNPVSTNPYYPVNGYTAAVFGGTFQLKDPAWSNDPNNFAPRVGLAWDMRGNGKSVLRMGGGIFYDRMWNNLFENIRLNPPLFAVSQQGFVAGTVQGPISTPGFYTFPLDIANFAGPGAVPSPRQMDQNLKTAYSEQVNFDFQQQLGQSWLLDAAYIGTFAHKLTGVADINTFNGRTGFGYSTRRINPNIGSDNMRGNFYNSNYHALQMRLTRRFSRGLQLNANYTWSHALDYISDAFNSRASDDYHPQDNYDRQLEYGNADFDIRHRFVSDFVWELPWLKTSKWLGGWSFNGTVMWQSGTPFTVFSNSVDANGDGHFNDRGIYTGPGAFGNAVNHSVSPADGYLRASDFIDTPVGSVPQDGWLARNAFFGPSYFNTDLSVSKAFKLNERLALKAIVSGFNIWNHPNFLMVPDQGTFQGGNIDDPNFGKSPKTVQPNNTGTGARVMQFALRLEF